MVYSYYLLLRLIIKVINLTETWLKDENANENSLRQIPNYTNIHLK